ncbi:branched-chain amino acid ABC transporter substrate-binding protein [Herbaspirillum sp. RV1423]|uniref:branched-chain amino acid ABC transporter substrate-binding protein n=1 Tax=Herbaspirillum sp. RV1423 TaxID=1443993 RepID=UPI00055814AE|nr:branched-chain amino acid ABC transporter substrate-binding protein [Herbaspirillum sp. RV1423]
MQTIFIGYAAPFKWALSLHSLQAAQQAILDANMKNIWIGGKKLQFRLLAKDDNSDPRTAQFVAKSLVSAGVTAVIGHWNSDTTLAAAPIYAEADIVQITTSATAERIPQQGYPGSFQMMGSDGISAQCVTDYLVKVMQAKRIALIDDGTAFGKNLAREYVDKMKELNGNIVVVESVSSKTSDFNAPLKKIKNAGADVILFSGSLLHSDDLARAMKRLQVPGKLFLPGGGTSKPFLDTAGTDLAHLLTIEPGSPKEKSATWKAFQASYRKMPTWDVSPYTILAYDAVNLIVKGMQLGNSTDPKKLAATLHKMKFEGLSGKIAFDDKGARDGPLYTIYAYDEDGWVPVKTYGN